MTSEPPRRSIEYESENDRYVLSPPRSGRLSVEVVLAVAEIAGVDPVEIDPVYPSFDPDAFDSAYETHRGDGIDVDGEVSVAVADHRVTIERDGRIVIDPPE